MNRKSLGNLLILPVIWGIYYLATNQSVAKMSVFATGVMIRLGALILLTVLMVVKGEMGQLLRVKKVWPRLVLIGVLGFLLDATAFAGLTLCPAGLGTVLLKSDILFVTLISVIFYHYRLKVMDCVYMLIMLCGIFMVMGVDFGHMDLGGAGNIFFILSALFVSINAFVIKGVQHDRDNPLGDHVVAYYNNLITMILFIITTVARGELPQLARPGMNPALAAALLVAALGQTLVYIVYYHNLRHYPVWIVKVFLLLMPVVTELISYVLFHEKLVGMQYLGMAVVLLCAGGIVMQQRGGVSTDSERTAAVK